MYDEAVLFVDSVFRDDAPLTTLIDADYAFVNDWLTDLYGIKDRIGGGDGKGELMRRVKLTDKNRGGILGLGAVLTVTRYPLRTSPVLRGKWVLERVLGAAAAAARRKCRSCRKTTVRRTASPSASSSKSTARVPSAPRATTGWTRSGLGLENFDAIGRWRTEAAGDPDRLIRRHHRPGSRSNGPAELKKVLLAHKAEFVRNLTEKMLGYALGRGLEYYDQPTVQADLRQPGEKRLPQLDAGPGDREKLPLPLSQECDPGRCRR